MAAELKKFVHPKAMKGCKRFETHGEEWVRSMLKWEGNRYKPTRGMKYVPNRKFVELYPGTIYLDARDTHAQMRMVGEKTVKDNTPGFWTVPLASSKPKARMVSRFVSGVFWDGHLIKKDSFLILWVPIRITLRRKPKGAKAPSAKAPSAIETALQAIHNDLQSIYALLRASLPEKKEFMEKVETAVQEGIGTARKGANHEKSTTPKHVDPAKAGSSFSRLGE